MKISKAWKVRIKGYKHENGWNITTERKTARVWTLWTDWRQIERTNKIKLQNRRSIAMLPSLWCIGYEGNTLMLGKPVIIQEGKLTG